MLYLLNNLPRVAELFGQHLFLTISSLALAILLGLPIGILIFRIEPLRGPVLAVLGVIYTIPSLSLLVLLIPLTGLSPATALVVRTIASGIIQRAASIAFGLMVRIRHLLDLSSTLLEQDWGQNVGTENKGVTDARQCEIFHLLGNMTT